MHVRGLSWISTASQSNPSLPSQPNLLSQIHGNTCLYGITSSAKMGAEFWYDEGTCCCCFEARSEGTVWHLHVWHRHRSSGAGKPDGRFHPIRFEPSLTDAAARRFLKLGRNADFCYEPVEGLLSAAVPTLPITLSNTLQRRWHDNHTVAGSVPEGYDLT